MSLEKMKRLLHEALVEADGVVEMPVDIPPPPPPVETVTLVKAGQNLQTVLDTLTGPTTIRLEPGTYIGNFVLQNKSLSSMVTIRPDVADSLLPAPNIRVGNIGQPVKFAAADSFSPTFQTAEAAHHYTLLGIELLPNMAHPDRDLMFIGSFEYTSLTQIPHHINLDRCYVHGSPEKGGHRGVSLNGANCIIRDCYFSEFWEQGRDSQALGGFCGPGPFLIENNYLEGSGENVMFGGSDPRIPNLVPSDIVIRGNHMFKPLAWKSKTGSVKNLFELKSARRVLIENNVFENNWVDGQAGAGILFTVRNQDGKAPWSTIEDVTFQYNVCKNIQGYWINILGLDTIKPSMQGKTIKILNNLAIGVGNGIQMSSPFQPTEIRHNTVTGVGGSFLGFYPPLLPPKMFTFVDNVVAGGLYGIATSGIGVGLPSLTAAAPEAEFHHNVIEGNTERVLTYPPGNVTLPPVTLAAKLDATFKYLGAETSSDGKLLGADTAEIMKRIPWLKL